MPVFSLPGPYGIGDFGSAAVSFGRTIAEAGFSAWQVLPLTPTGYGHSPYQCYSVYAGNPLFISPEILTEQGLIRQEECAAAVYVKDLSQVDYGWLEQERHNLLHLAWSRTGRAEQQAVAAYAADQHDWLDDYVLYRVIKHEQGGQPWWAWSDEALRQADPAALADVRKRAAELIEFYRFIEYEFDRQWHSLKKRLKACGIQVIGDLPIYVSADSADVWAAKRYFDLDQHNRFSHVAGVPPDYFTPEGQRWGNPLYDWQAMATDKYRWWIRRVQAGLVLFDAIRIDHFRGFESYWAIPGDAKTARHGHWRKGPAMDLFDHILKAFPAAPIIAEDLGDIDDNVRRFLKQTGLPGMKVMQFAFNPSAGGVDRPHRFPRHCVAYSGTHDNTTLAAWLKQLEAAERDFVREYCGAATCEAVLRCLWQSCAERIIVPLQDLLGLGVSARINTPGTAVGNWRFRFTQTQIDGIDWNRFRRYNEIFERFPAVIECSQLELHHADK